MRETRVDRIGEEKINNQGLKMIIIAYRNGKDIDVKFEDGYIAEHKDYKQFLKGGIMNHNYKKGAIRVPKKDEPRNEVNNIPGEVWVNINGFESYMVSNYGRIKKLYASGKEKIIKVKEKNKVCLYNNKNELKTTLGRLVAQSFIRDLEENEIVIHIDGDITNNKVNNLSISNPKEKAEKNFIEKFNLLHGDKWEYVGGYINCRECVTIKCKVCGDTKTIIADNVVRDRETICNECRRIEKEKREKEIKLKRQEREKNKLTYEQQKERVRQRAHERYIKNFKSEEKTCKYCGKKFMTEYKKSKVFCSKECAKKNLRYQTKIHDKRRKGLIKNSIMVDKDITLPKLFKRDKGVCAICGGKCDYKDFTEKDGIIIVGDNYPSIDHIKPLSKGGTHTWGNVQLAHKLCNSIKCDKIIEQEEEQLKWI